MSKSDLTKLPSVLVGVAGVHLVAAELSRRGYVASITLRNTRGMDILVSNADASRQVGIQVKTHQGNLREWILNDKAEDYFARNLYYVFVNLKEAPNRPEFHVVPSRVVARYIKTSHRRWLRHRGRGGRKHRDNTMRIFKDREGKYLNHWTSLRLD